MLQLLYAVVKGNIYNLKISLTCLSYVTALAQDHWHLGLALESSAWKKSEAKAQPEAELRHDLSRLLVFFPQILDF